MEWRKTRISTTRWDAGSDYRITQDVECAGDQFRLESFAAPDGEVEYFATLEQAKAAANRLNDLAWARADNERLRRELDELRQANAFGRGADGANGPANGNGHTATVARTVSAAVHAGPELVLVSEDGDSPF